MRHHHGCPDGPDCGQMQSTEEHNAHQGDSMTVNIATLADTLAPHVGHLATLQAQIAALQSQAETVKAEIRDIVATFGPGTYGTDQGAVTVSLNRRLDVDALARDYPVDACPELYDLVPSTKKARAILAPTVVDHYMVTQGEPRVTVREA